MRGRCSSLLKSVAFGDFIELVWILTIAELYRGLYLSKGYMGWSLEEPSVYVACIC
jgi:hypothetical protein